jgi:hypothetical protein
MRLPRASLRGLPKNGSDSALYELSLLGINVMAVGRGASSNRLGRQVLDEVANGARPDIILGWYRKLVARNFATASVQGRRGQSNGAHVLRREVAEGHPRSDIEPGLIASAKFRSRRHYTHGIQSRNRMTALVNYLRMLVG